jgi:hypothetical protein
VHHYENGKIKRESTYWDAASILADMGQPISKAGVTAPAYSADAV